jgi:hypothetical protein
MVGGDGTLEGGAAGSMVGGVGTLGGGVGSLFFVEAGGRHASKKMSASWRKAWVCWVPSWANGAAGAGCSKAWLDDVASG